MVDVLTTAQRRLNMSRIRGKNTKPEYFLRKGLHAEGLRFRLHDAKLPGRPDAVFSKYKVVLFVHGCFWHNHKCELCRVPSTRTEFWMKKIQNNAFRDKRAISELRNLGWRSLVVWECAIRGRGRCSTEFVITRSASFIRSGRKPFLEIAGTITRKD